MEVASWSGRVFAFYLLSRGITDGEGRLDLQDNEKNSTWLVAGNVPQAVQPAADFSIARLVARAANVP